MVQKNWKSKEWVSERNRIYREKHKVRLTIKRKQYEQATLPIVSIQRWVRRQWAKLSRREWFSEKEWAYSLRKYRITSNDYYRILDAQGGGCAICGSAEAGRKGFSHLCIDHVHGSNPPKVRGVLCYQCNFSLGGVREDPEILWAMIAYLEFHSIGKGIGEEAAAQDSA